MDKSTTEALDAALRLLEMIQERKGIKNLELGVEIVIDQLETAIKESRAPIELPEADAEIDVHSMKTYLDLSIHEWNDKYKDGVYKIYTESTILTLLAKHGIDVV